MKFEDLKYQSLADQMDGWLILKNGQEALALFETLPDDQRESEAGLYWLARIQGALGRSDDLLNTVDTGLKRFPTANWPVHFFAAIVASTGREADAISLLTTRHNPPLERWNAHLQVAQHLAIRFPERARLHYCEAAHLSPESEREFVAETAVEYPPLLAAIQAGEKM